MFEDSLLERRFIKSHRGRATIISFALQIVLLGTLVAMPLFFVEALPARELVTFIVAPSPPPPPPPPVAETPHVKVIKHKIESEMLDNGELREPKRIPKKIAMIKESAPPPPSVSGVMGGVPGGIPGGVLGGVIGGILRSSPAAHLAKVASPKVVQPQRVRVSQGVTEGMLVHQVKPIYPSVAREARVQGPVVLKAIIAKDGTIQSLQLISGNPFLARAAIEAVKEWRYRPYLLNGQPVEVETNITINFNLGSDA